MLCGIPCIPSTQCPGQWYPSNLQWAGEILGLSLGSATEIRPAAMNLNVKKQRRNAASQAEDHNNGPCQHSLIVTISVVIHGLGGVTFSLTLYAIMSQLLNPVELIFKRDEKYHAIGINSTVWAFRHKSDCGYFIETVVNPAVLHASFWVWIWVNSFEV